MRGEEGRASSSPESRPPAIPVGGRTLLQHSRSDTRSHMGHWVSVHMVPPPRAQEAQGVCQHLWIETVRSFGGQKGERGCGYFIQSVNIRGSQLCVRHHTKLQGHRNKCDSDLSLEALAVYGQKHLEGHKLRTGPQLGGCPVSLTLAIDSLNVLLVASMSPSRDHPAHPLRGQ